MTPGPDTLRTFGARFQMTGELVSTALYDEYQVHDSERGVAVGLWVPRPALFAAPLARDRLARAATEVRAVIHPGLRRVFAAGAEPAPWVSLQPARPLPADAFESRAALIGSIDAIAAAVVALHRAGLVHGGVIEHDVVAVDGELRLGGGGIWACADPIAVAGATGGVLIAPERRGGGPATAVADAWSFAALIARWVGGPGPDPLLIALRRHPALAAEIGPMLTDDPARRRHDLIELAGAARAALALPFTDEAPTASARGRRRKKNTTEETTRVGRAAAIGASSGTVAGEIEPTERTAPPVAPVPQEVADVRSAPIVAVSMKPGGPGGPRFDQPTPPAPTPQLQRPVLRPPTRDDGASLGRLAPPRAKVEAERREARRPWIAAAIAVLVVTVIVLAILVAR